MSGFENLCDECSEEQAEYTCLREECNAHVCEGCLIFEDITDDYRIACPVCEYTCELLSNNLVQEEEQIL